MPQYIRIAVIAVLSSVVATQALAQGNSDQSNGVPHVIQEALANGINVEVTNSPTVTVENQVDVAVVGETEVVVTNASPIEVTVSNFPDTSGGGDDESGYLGLSSVAVNGAGGLTSKFSQCQVDFDQTARMCSDQELIESKDLTKFSSDLLSVGQTRAWVRPVLVSHTYNQYGATFIWASYPALRNDLLSARGFCLTDRESEYGLVLGLAGDGKRQGCERDTYVACCR